MRVKVRERSEEEEERKEKREERKREGKNVNEPFYDAFGGGFVSELTVVIMHVTMLYCSSQMPVSNEERGGKKRV